MTGHGLTAARHFRRNKNPPSSLTLIQRCTPCLKPCFSCMDLLASAYEGNYGTPCGGTFHDVQQDVRLRFFELVSLPHRLRVPGALSFVKHYRVLGREIACALKAVVPEERMDVIDESA